MYTQFFGNYLLANGYVTRDQLFSAMRQEADQHMKLGTLALHAGYMNAAQVDDVVIHQTHQDKPEEGGVKQFCQMRSHRSLRTGRPGYTGAGP